MSGPKKIKNALISVYFKENLEAILHELKALNINIYSTGGTQDFIEKLGIGGISLIRAGAKNFRDVVIVSSREQYPVLIDLLRSKKGSTDLADRRALAAKAFDISSHYDTAIFNWFKSDSEPVFKQSIRTSQVLRYGENPHQQGIFYGKMDELFEKLNGKELSYNNLLDVDAAVNLISDFRECTFAILKHNNACGIASRPVLADAWRDALAGDPQSAFGGILITNTKLDAATASEIHKLFFEVIIAPAYDEAALDILKQKPNRIILIQKVVKLPSRSFRSLLNGIIEQEKDEKTESRAEMKPVTKRVPLDTEYSDLEFANVLVKHTKSNTIVLAKNKQLLGSGTGQTSRIDALRQAIVKAGNFGFDLHGAVMASDAFFPFPDCVEIAHHAGITAVVQPGGSIKDKESIAYCEENGMAMVLTGIRHFKH
jgi:phosphoribosylaminoimidazolecarboxamide formyltransferase/IMP cyclohydrolase